MPSPPIHQRNYRCENALKGPKHLSETTAVRSTLVCRVSVYRRSCHYQLITPVTNNDDSNVISNLAGLICTPPYLQQAESKTHTRILVHAQKI